jgi:hypothetical protein
MAVAVVVQEPLVVMVANTVLAVRAVLVLAPIQHI